MRRSESSSTHCVQAALASNKEDPRCPLPLGFTVTYVRTSFIYLSSLASLYGYIGDMRPSVLASSIVLGTVHVPYGTTYRYPKTTLIPWEPILIAKEQPEGITHRAPRSHPP